MGSFLSRFRKKKEIVEQLEELDAQIKTCINFRLENQESQRRWVGRCTLWGLIAYAALALLYYLMYFPEAWIERVVYSALLIFVPFLLLLASRRTLTWYYARRITSNEEKLLRLKEEKDSILEDVMETETYKKAKEILEKFDPGRHKAMTPPRAQTPKTPAPETLGSELRLRKGENVVSALKAPVAPPAPSSAVQAIGPAPGTPFAVTQSSNGMILRPPSNTPIRPMTPGTFRHQTPRPPMTNLTPRALIMPSTNRPPVLPRPVLPSERGILDRMVEYLVGDGPSNRYALVCRRCNRHNGMALREEFEYLSFHCAYCYFLNPAKRKRPSAPRLPESNPASARESEADSEAESISSPPPRPLRPAGSLGANSPLDRPAVDEGVDEVEESSPREETALRSAESESLTKDIEEENKLEMEDGEEDAEAASSEASDAPPEAANKATEKEWIKKIKDNEGATKAEAEEPIET